MPELALSVPDPVYDRYRGGCVDEGVLPVSRELWERMRAAVPPVPSAVNPALTAHRATGGCPHCGGRPRRKRTRRPTEATDFAQMVARMLRAHGRRVADADTEDLADLIALREVLEEAIAYAVRESRARHGRSWADIARAAQSTKQAAQQRWGQRS